MRNRCRRVWLTRTHTCKLARPNGVTAVPDHRAMGMSMRDAWRMTRWQSLLYCAAADVTLERIRNLVAVTGTEPLTVDFKEGSTPAVAECAVAMATCTAG